jgi:hypothetical protein
LSDVSNRREAAIANRGAYGAASGRAGVRTKSRHSTEAEFAPGRFMDRLNGWVAGRVTITTHGQSDFYGVRVPIPLRL